MVKLESLKKIDRFVIILGYGCNTFCRHCIQKYNITNNLISPCLPISYDFLDLLVLWSHCVPDKKRKVFEKANIVFYGGEPLLYFDKIKTIILYLKEKNFDFNKVELKLFSNCLLLTDEMVDFFNKHNVFVGLSADGPNLTFVRKKFPDSLIVSRWKNIKNRFVVSVVTSGNPDFVKNVLFLKDKFDVEHVDIELVKVGWDMPKDIYSFRDFDFKNFFSRILLYYESHPLDYSFYSFFHDFLPEYIEPDGYVTFSVECDGHVGVRRFYNKIIGTIYDDFDFLYDSSRKCMESRYCEVCRSCKYLDVCFTAVVLKDLNYGDLNFYYCAYFRAFMKALELNKDNLVELIRRN